MMASSAPAVGSNRPDKSRAYRFRSVSGLRATPESIAALATAGGMREIKRGSKAFGMM